MKIHIVQKGDTLWKISQKYGVDFEELKKLNSQLSNPDMIMPGMKIKIPSGNVHVKKEAVVNNSPVKENIQKEAQVKKETQVKKENIKAEHPYKDLSPEPKPVMDVEKMQPKKEVANNAPPKTPYVPKMPTQIDVDINNSWNVNAPEINMPQAPANILPGMMKPEFDEVESVQEVAPPKMPEMPKLPEVPAGYTPQMPVAPAQDTDPYCEPITPVMPGDGFNCYPEAPFHGAPAGVGFPEGYAPVPPAQGFQPAVPSEYDDDDIELPPAPPWNLGAPTTGAPFTPAPYGGFAGPQVPGVGAPGYPGPEAPGGYSGYPGPQQVPGMDYQGYPGPVDTDETDLDEVGYQVPQGMPMGYQPAPFPQGGQMGYQPAPFPQGGQMGYQPAPFPQGGQMGYQPAPFPQGGQMGYQPAPYPLGGPMQVPGQGLSPAPGMQAPPATMRDCGCGGPQGYPGYGPLQGGYPEAMPGYGAPMQGGYPEAMPGYGAPMQGGYPEGVPGYGPPMQGGYQGATPGYPTPVQGYPGAVPGYGAPVQGGYPEVAPGYGAPTQGYGAPVQGGYPGMAPGFAGPTQGYPGLTPQGMFGTSPYDPTRHPMFEFPDFDDESDD
ncbi:SafA/ExsA family spore coat assembly protein [Litchfieldia salsa]|uniref:Morphogenetic protein associated with SpoVID n=1 Tax=Litchfieldia salsa TaxID=930152 RepID=A0A1H0V4G7_9BACI|nr:SafA/ExsA family spore coat assembly protein [Litchfieldia salsa]SDP73422.1 morphogenetic protein associated with SpoVID [Litchfieldia salsa]